MGKEAERREAAPVPVAAGFHQSSGAESGPPVAAMNMNLFIQLRQMGSHSAGGDVEHSRMLFALLDTDGSGDLTPSEFDKLPALEEKLKKQAKLPVPLLPRQLLPVLRQPLSRRQLLLQAL